MHGVIQQILERLTSEGLLNKNKLLPTHLIFKYCSSSLLKMRLAWVTFKKDADALDQAGVCHFVYHTATFQGNTAATSISEALANALRQWAKDLNTPPDLIVIIRGGGAVNDLAYLNDYNLAALLANALFRSG